jgi:hypothetical protein
MYPPVIQTPFRNEKNTGWEGGFRMPFMVQDQEGTLEIWQREFKGLHWFLKRPGTVRVRRNKATAAVKIGLLLAR